ncbi:DoxX family membrane protein [Nocardia sp. CA2R105]|uniref:DoxX family membrane protein n=1 Tax=Nocardia coffeae TaxID=2873381 RepID=UPI001CA62C69|nr:DoxX family membrane protein [Nocardia coffeae]MBY8863506.1 DoxX family membrane protein [Nocardia coffeae]
MLLRRIARPLLATAFVVDGATMFIHPEPLTESRIAAKSPTDPARLVWIIAASRIGGGLLLALGAAPRVAALTLTATTIPVLLAEQEFRSESDPERRSARATAFVKDIGLLGGLLLAVADTEGKPSLGWRGRRAAREAADAISAALPARAVPAGDNAVARHTRDVLEHRMHDALDTARTLAEQARHEAVDFTNAARPIITDTARERGAELAETALRHGERLLESTRTRGAELAETTRNRGAELAETTRHRGAELAETTRNRGAELAETVKHRLPNTAATAG